MKLSYLKPVSLEETCPRTWRAVHATDYFRIFHPPDWTVTPSGTRISEVGETFHVHRKQFRLGNSSRKGLSDIHQKTSMEGEMCVY
jgi:hypothetical protein